MVNRTLACCFCHAQGGPPYYCSPSDYPMIAWKHCMTGILCVRPCTVGRPLKEMAARECMNGWKEKNRDRQHVFTSLRHFKSGAVTGGVHTMKMARWFSWYS